MHRHIFQVLEDDTGKMSANVPVELFCSRVTHFYGQSERRIRLSLFTKPNHDSSDQSRARKKEKQEETYSLLHIKLRNSNLQHLIGYRLSLVNQRGEDISHERLYSRGEVQLGERKEVLEDFDEQLVCMW